MMLISKVAGDRCGGHLSEEACLGIGGCRWFSVSRWFFVPGYCPHCKQLFGRDSRGVTGCHDWDPQWYCHHRIYEAVQRRIGSSLREDWFKVAFSHFRITQGSGESGNPHKKESTCSIWCDLHGTEPCFGQPRARAAKEIRGINYGGRFVPEDFLGLQGTREILFKDVQKPQYSKDLSLCDVGGTADAGHRMAQFLDMNIKAEHFRHMAELGFNVVRLPLGYWNLIDLPHSSTPNGPPEVSARFRNLQNLMPALSYRKWIDLVFQHAQAAGIKVMMDLHTAPGGQSGNQNTGCDLGEDGNLYFVTDWNRQLGKLAIESMAAICAEKGSTCWGIELLNEPYGPHDEHALPRETLRRFYAGAIEAARRHLHKDVPLVINDWPTWIKSYWKYHTFSYAEHGRIVFSTHLYQYPKDWTTDQQQARDSFERDLQVLSDFHKNTGSEIFVSEYALNSHGHGKEGDGFDYGAFTHWFVHQFNQHGLGSVIWNYDSYHEAWGPGQHHKRVGLDPIPWANIHDHGERIPV